MESLIPCLSNTVSLAPMVRMNTLPFRQLSLQHGADYVFSEEIIDRKLISCVRVENPVINTIDYVVGKGDYSLVISIRPEERPKFILQIGTNSPETAILAVERLLPDISGVDVNMGCPKTFSTQGGMGAALMRDQENAFNIMKSLVEKFGQKISVSCKIRVLRNFDDTLKYILAMQEAGVHWITIHPRTAAEETRVPARWYSIKSFLDTGLIKIPILGSGDLFSPLDVHKYLTSTGASGVILARGAIHNPGIFQLKSKMLDRAKSLIDMQENDDDWKDNTVEPIISEEQKLQKEQEEDKRESKKKMGSALEDESIEFSQNLVKVYERRYARYPMTTDIIEYVREYFKYAIACGNHYQNTKYCILYMLKTHKHRFDLFKQIHGSKTLGEQAQYLGMEHLFDDLTPDHYLMFKGEYYRKNREIVDKAAQEQGVLEQLEKLSGKRHKDKQEKKDGAEETDETLQIKRIKTDQ